MQKNLKVVACTFLFLIATANSHSAPVDYKNQLTGKRLIMKGAICAGLVFDSNSRYASMVGEIDCTHGYDDGLPLRVKWVKADTFVLIEREQQRPDSPPRTFIYTVTKIKGNKVLLTEYWTGWNDFKDETKEYTLK